MSLNGKIFFANNISHIFSGDDVDLLIEIENQEKVFVKEIYLTFYGIASVKWEDLMHKNKDGKIIYFMQTFEDEQILVNRHIKILTMAVLSEGKYHYKVRLNIPPQLPQNIARKYGSVKYELELGANCATGVKLLCKIPLDIKEYLNICHCQGYMEPYHTILKKSPWWGMCITQPLKVVVTLPKKSFIPGDFINYFIKIEHFSKLLDLRRLSVILSQMQHYKSYRPKEKAKHVHTTLSRTMHFFSKNHHDANLKGSLQIPHSLVPTSTNPWLLNTSYKVLFILVFGAFHTDGYISIPIIVGSHRELSEKIDSLTKHEAILQMEANEKFEYEV